MKFTLLRLGVRVVLLVLADVFYHLGVRQQIEANRRRPGARVGLRIIDRHFHLHVTVVAPAEALDSVERVGVRMPQSSSHDWSLNPRESTTNVSPSHFPIE